MLISKTVEAHVTPRNIGSIRKAGYDCELGDHLMIATEHLTKTSHVKVVCSCDLCGKEYILPYYKYIQNFERGGYYGCRGCSRVKAKKTNLELYGVDNYSMTKECRTRVENTNLERYGVKCTFLDDTTREKIRETNRRLYGSDYYLGTKECREKTQSYMLEEYGVVHYSKTEEFKKSILQRRNDSLMEVFPSYGITDFKILDDHTIDIKCDLGLDHYFNITAINLRQRRTQKTVLCTVCNEFDRRQSGREIEIADFIKQHYIGEIRLKDTELLGRKEVDIYLPEKKLAIEFNGLYWHSELYKNKEYHLNKTLACREKGVCLLHIWEDEWTDRRDVVKSRLLEVLGLQNEVVDAEECDVVELSHEEMGIFLRRNDIVDYKKSTYRLGLNKGGESIVVMSLEKKGDNWVLNHCCARINTKVTGGLSKLFTHFVRERTPMLVTSKFPNSWDSGTLYSDLGFHLVGEITPGHFYLDGRFKTRLRRIPKSIRETGDKCIRIYDCGQQKLEWRDES